MSTNPEYGDQSGSQPAPQDPYSSYGGQSAYDAQGGYGGQDTTAYGSGYPAQPSYSQANYGQDSMTYGQGAQPGYGQPAYDYNQGYAVQPRTNTMATLSLVMSLVGLLTGITAVLGIIFGHIARKQIRETGEGGDGMALAGLIVGYIICGLWVLGILAYIALVVFMFGAAGMAGAF